MVAESHRLGDLQMRIAGHRGGGLGLGPVDQRLLQVAHRLVEPVDRAAQPQAEIGRHLVVARTRGMEPAGGRADQLGKPRLDIHVDVFERLAEGKGTALDFRLDPV